MQTHGCKKSDLISNFYKHSTKEVGFLSVSFIPFREHRFNVLLHNGRILYYLHDHLQHYFDTADYVKLLKVVHLDLQIQSYLYGCSALGLINKFVTGHLWRLLESGIDILDSIMQYQKMHSLLFDLSVDATEFMLDVIFFENMIISKADLYSSLAFPSNILDEPTKKMF